MAYTKFQKEVNDWACKTFPASTKHSKISHLKKELAELEAATDPEDIAEEAADCLILLLHLAGEFKFDLLAKARHKLAINKKRQWGAPDCNGVVEHVRAKKNSSFFIQRARQSGGKAGKGCNKTSSWQAVERIAHDRVRIVRSFRYLMNNSESERKALLAIRINGFSR